MCLHSFTHSSNQDLNFCILCGCISISGHTTLKFSYYNTKTSISPLTSLSQALNTSLTHLNPDYSNPLHTKYISVRSKELKSMSSLKTQLKCDKVVLHRAIRYLDQLFLGTNCQLDYHHMSLICFFISMEFNDSISLSSIDTMTMLLLKSIPQFRMKEIQCLQYLNYDLNQLSTYDILRAIFFIGIPLNQQEEDEEEEIDMQMIYSLCLVILEDFVFEERVIDFTAKELAFGIVKCVCEKYRRLDMNKFEDVYGVNYKDVRMVRCGLVLASINQFKYQLCQRKLRKYTEKNDGDSTSDD